MKSVFINFALIAGVILLSLNSCKPDDKPGNTRTGDAAFVGSQVYTILTDDAGEVWIGTDAGVSRLIDGNLANPQWINYSKLIANGDRINDLLIFSEGAQRYLWMATSQRLSRYTIDGDSLVFELADASGMMQMPKSFNDIATLLPGQYGFATEDGPILITDGKVRVDSFGINSIKRYPQTKIEGKVINQIGFLDGDYYFLTNGSRLYRTYRNINFADSLDAFTSCTEWEPPYNGNVSDTMYAFYKVNDTTCWMGGKGGVVYQSGHDPKAWASLDYSGQLINPSVHSISGDANGRIWFGTEEGISILDGTSWSTFTSADGLPGDTVFAMQPFKGKMLVGTEGGLTVVTVD